MKKFVLNIFVFFSINIIFIIVVWCIHAQIIGNQYLGIYNAAILDKVERLVTIDEPKIILIGNSNWCFGVDSEMLEATYGMPVVDMGLHGGLGNKFQENLLKLGLNEGDIVILCHTSYADNNSFDDVSLAWITLEHHKELWSILTIQDYIYLISGFPEYIKTSIRLYLQGSPSNIPEDEGSYSRTSFNCYGDINRREDPNYEYKDGDAVVPQINEICINRLNRLNKYITNHGAVMYVSAYPIVYGDYTPEKSDYDDFENELRNKMDCPIISHYSDYFIPYEYFYDFKYHLTDEGVIIRTEKLIDDLAKYM